MSEQILLVDDELKVLKAYERNLSMDYEIAVESSPEQALQRLKYEGPFAVMLTDYNMPHLNGNELLKEAKVISPDTVSIMLTGNADLEKSMIAVNEGSVFRFLTKPCPIEQLQKCLDDAIRQYQLVNAERELLTKTLNGSVKVMLEILSIMNHSAFSLAQKRSKAAKYIAKELSIENIWAIEMGAMLSDIGMVTLPDDTMQRVLTNQKLCETEQKMIDSLPEMSAKLVGNIPRLEEVGRIVKYHRKNYDGSGAPHDSIRGTQIPIGARIIHVVNDYFRIVSKGSSPNEAYSMLNLAGDHYDKSVLKALAKASKDISTPKENKNLIQKIGVNGLKIGQILRSDVFGTNGMLILKSNQILGPTHIQRICNFDSSCGVKEPILVESATEQ